MSCKEVLIQDPITPGEAIRVVCTDENGVEWWIPDPAEQCDVGDWVAFQRQGGEVERLEPKPETKPLLPDKGKPKPEPRKR